MKRNKMYENQLAKIAKNEDQTLQAIASKTLVRNLDINITGVQAHWIKYRTWSYKKMKKKKKKELVQDL